MNLIAIKDGKVVNSIDVDRDTKYASRQHLEAQGFTVVENATAAQGDTFDGENFSKAVPVTPSRVLTHRQFIKRLTTAEFKKIRQAAKTDADVDMFMYLFERAQGVTMNDPDTVEGVNMLEAKNLINAGRAAAILA